MSETVEIKDVIRRRLLKKVTNCLLELKDALEMAAQYEITDLKPLNTIADAIKNIKPSDLKEDTA